MNEQKAKFTWHYYVMAFGALLSLLAATVGSIGGIVSGLAMAVVMHPSLQFQGLTRWVFVILFAIMYVFAFPEADVIRDMMSIQPIE